MLNAYVAIVLGRYFTGPLFHWECGERLLR